MLPICLTTNVNVIKERSTEMCYMPFTDDNNNTHTHDYNSGTVTLLCCNEHKTDTQIKRLCECGWTY